MSPYDVGHVQNLGALLGTEFDGRAQFDVSLYVSETASEFDTYIETVEITDNDNDNVFEVSV
jgi:hypothetical protein